MEEQVAQAARVTHARLQLIQQLRAVEQEQAIGVWQIVMLQDL
jgi:hypothetical protein